MLAERRSYLLGPAAPLAAAIVVYAHATKPPAPLPAVAFVQSVVY
jgi:hypothetical protein